MKLFKSILIILLLCMLSGCGGDRVGETKPAGYRVVTQIHVFQRNTFGETEYRYEDPERMQQILNYLRWVDPYGIPEEDPMTQPGEEFVIRMYYSDGTTKIYHQRCDRYLRVGEGAWKKIAPERGRELRGLLGNLGRGETHTPADSGPTQPLLCPKL